MSGTPLRILFVEDSEVDVELALQELRRAAFAPVYQRVDTPAAMSSALDLSLWDIILSDHGMPRFSGMDALRMVKERELDVPFILLSGSIGETQAVEMMKAGACDYVMKDRPGRLGPTIRRELEEAKTRRERRSAQEGLKAERNFISAILDTAGALVMVLAPDGRISRVNRAFEKLTGFPGAEVLGRLFWEIFLLPEEAEQEKLRVGTLDTTAFPREHETTWLSKGGMPRKVAWTETALFDEKGAVSFLIWTGIDVTEKKLLEAQLEHDALHDALTGLANRTLFLERLGQQIRHVQRRKESCYAVLFIDIDRFKIVNDSLGHVAGDQLLREIARNLEACIRPADTISRLGGDEFAVLLEDIQGISDATHVAERIAVALSRTRKLGGQEITSSASIGIALGAERYTRAEDVLRDADTAMYRAKAQGRARFEVFDESMRARAIQLLELETDLRRALERGELAAYYQPIVGVVDQGLVGFEALVRWNHPKRGLVPPQDFIPLAEELGLITTVDRWVLREACRQVKEWQDRFPRESPLSISVNLSSRHFSRLDVAGEVDRILKETRLPSRDLKLEITESVLLESTESTRQSLLDLRSMGAHLHIDDFGTGYSSLSYLRNFPIDALKVDRSFISSLKPTRDGEAIVKAIVMLAHNLDMKVVAEGVETPGQLDLLRRLGCEYAQGYHFAKPLRREQAETLVASPRPSWQST